MGHFAVGSGIYVNKSYIFKPQLNNGEECLLSRDGFNQGVFDKIYPCVITHNM
jgi:hypothetical protein